MKYYGILIIDQGSKNYAYFLNIYNSQTIRPSLQKLGRIVFYSRLLGGKPYSFLYAR